MGAVVVDAVRTCVGRRGGALANWHAVDLLAFAYKALMERLDLDPAALSAISASTRTAVGEQSLNVARNAALAAGWNPSIPGFTFEGDASAGIAAVQNAVAFVDHVGGAVLIGGCEVASRVPPGASTGIACGKPYGPQVHARYADIGGLVPPHVIAEKLARRYGLDRVALDEWTAESRSRAAKNASSELLKKYVLPLPVRADRAADHDPWHVSDDLHYGDIVELKPSFDPDGLITAANMAQSADAASSVLIASQDFARRHGLPVLAHVGAINLRGSDPIEGDAGVRLLSSMTKVDHLDTLFVQEDFAVTALAQASVLGRDRVNPSGGALAYGDVGGATVGSLLAEASQQVSISGESAIVMVAGASQQRGAIELRGQ